MGAFAGIASLAYVSPSIFCGRLRAPKRGYVKEERSNQHGSPTYRVLGKTYHFRSSLWFAREIYPHVCEEFLPVEPKDIPNNPPIFPRVITRGLPALFELLSDEKNWPEDEKENLESDFQKRKKENKEGTAETFKHS